MDDSSDDDNQWTSKKYDIIKGKKGVTWVMRLNSQVKSGIRGKG